MLPRLGHPPSLSCATTSDPPASSSPGCQRFPADCALSPSPLRCIFNFFPTAGILTFLNFKLEIIPYLEKSCKNSTENSQIPFSEMSPDVNFLLSYDSHTINLTHLMGTIMIFRVVQLSPQFSNTFSTPQKKLQTY